MDPEAPSEATWSSPLDPFTPDEELLMWRFLISHQLATAYSFQCVWEKFKRASGSKRSVQCLYNRFFNDMIPKLHLAHFDIETKLWLFEKYRIVMSREALATLSEKAELIVDDCGFLIRYRVKNYMNDISRFPFSVEEDVQMWEYLIDCPENVVSYSLWDEFRKLTGTLRTTAALCNRFQNHLTFTLHRMPFDIPTKVKLYTKFRIRVEKQYIKVICRHMNVTVDRHGLVLGYNYDAPEVPGYPRATKEARIENSIDSVLERVRKMPLPQREQVNWTVYTNAIEEVKLADILAPEVEEEVEIVDTPPKTPKVEKDPEVWIQKTSPEMNTFIQTLKDEISEVVDVSNAKLIENVLNQLASSNQNQNQKNLKSSITDFLVTMKTFCGEMKSSRLETRMDSAIQSINNGKIPPKRLTTAIEAALNVLQC